MNQTPETTKVDGVLEITVKEGKITKDHTIYASRINGNGTWKYVRSNGQTLAKKSYLNPEEMAQAIKTAHAGKNLEGEVYWSYNKQ